MFVVHLLGISSMLNSLNTIGTVIAGSSSSQMLSKVSLFIWGVLLTSGLLIATLPILSGAVTMVILDRNFNTCFFDVVGGGDLILFQHLFWFFGHPEVYIIILPVFGLVSLILDSTSFRSVFSMSAMIYSMSSISVLGFFVWAHHMFTTGLDIDSRSYFGSVTLTIGVPTCIKIFNWLLTVCSHDFMSLYMDELFVYIFIMFFLCGGISGFFLGNVGLDILLHDTYFVVGHFHFVLSLGAVVGVMGGGCHFFVFWFCSEYLFLCISVSLLFFCIGSFLLFFPLHFIGGLGFPSSISDFPICLFNCCLWVLISLYHLFIVMFPDE